jgi:hypothetical protein
MELIINKKGKKYNYHELQLFNRNDNLHLSCINNLNGIKYALRTELMYEN